MIQPHELRIGNLVLYRKMGEGNRVLHVVTPGTFGRFPFHAKEFEPIPLTPELLEKCGFAYGPFVYTDGSTGDGFIKGMFKISELQISNEFDGYGAEYFPYPQSHNCLPGNMKYLHELQNNYFCWTGEELPIEL